MKQKLLLTNLFIDNQYLDLYVQLINNNLDTKKQKFMTQRHHIIPSVFFQKTNYAERDSKDNLVNLLYKDHILAHYYLALCLKESELKYKMMCAINFILGKAKQNKLNVDELKEFTFNLDEYQKLYEESKKIFGNKLKGKTHLTSQETKEKIGKANCGKIYVTRDEEVRAISSDQLQTYLQQGWSRGNPNSQNRNTHKGDTIIHKGDIEKYIPKNLLSQYIQEGWEQGRSEKHKKATQCGTQKYFDNLSQEEKKKLYATYGAKGRKASAQERKKLSEKLKGRKLSEEHKELIKKQRQNTIHMTNGVKSILIKAEFEDQYIKLGYYRGRTLKKKRGEIENE